MEIAMSEAQRTAGSAKVDRLKKFILERFPLARKAGLNGETPLLEGGIVDSLGILELVNFMEEEFGISVVDEELVPENFSSIDSLLAFLDHKEPGS